MALLSPSCIGIGCNKPLERSPVCTSATDDIEIAEKRLVSLCRNGNKQLVYKHGN